MIGDWISSLADWVWCWILTGIIVATNMILAALGALLAAAIALLPAMPDNLEVPEVILQGFLYVRYVFPLDFFSVLMVWFSGMYLVWWIVRIPLRWGKADP